MKKLMFFALPLSAFIGSYCFSMQQVLEKENIPQSPSKAQSRPTIEPQLLRAIENILAQEKTEPSIPSVISPEKKVKRVKRTLVPVTYMDPLERLVRELEITTNKVILLFNFVNHLADTSRHEPTGVITNPHFFEAYDRYNASFNQLLDMYRGTYEALNANPEIKATVMPRMNKVVEKIQFMNNYTGQN